MLRKFLGVAVGWLSAILCPPLSESDTQPAAKPPPPYGHALMGVRVLKFDGAIAPKVLKFDAPLACTANMI